MTYWSHSRRSMKGTSMVSIKRYFQVYADYKSGKPGDAGYLEFKAYGWGVDSVLLTQLRTLPKQYNLDLKKLIHLPVGTLGHEYAKHMKKYGIQPLEISADLQADAEENPFALRLLTVHDIYHVLLGFDITYAGEAGVFAFKAAQGDSRMLPILQPLALVGICLMKPKSMWQTIANFRRGRSLGKQAKCLLTYRFADNWAKPVSEIRSEMGLSENSNW